MNTIPLQATVRETFGKGEARKLRAKGNIPALVYRAGAAPKHIAIDPVVLTKLFRASNNQNTLLDVQVDGQSFICIVREAQKHPVSRELLHVDLYEVLPTESVLIEVPLLASGRAAGVAAGGKLNVLARAVNVRCMPADIPAVIDVDVTPLNINEGLRMSQIPEPAGCTFVYQTDFNVVLVVGKRVDAKGDES